MLPPLSILPYACAYRRKKWTTLVIHLIRMFALTSSNVRIAVNEQPNKRHRILALTVSNVRIAVNEQSNKRHRMFALTVSNVRISCCDYGFIGCQPFRLSSMAMMRSPRADLRSMCSMVAVTKGLVSKSPRTCSKSRSTVCWLAPSKPKPV